MNRGINFIQPNTVVRVFWLQYGNLLIGLSCIPILLLLLASIHAWNIHQDKIAIANTYEKQKKEQNIGQLQAQYINREKQVQEMYVSMKSNNQSFKVVLLAAACRNTNIVLDKVEFLNNEVILSGKGQKDVDVREYIEKLKSSTKGVHFEEQQNLDGRNQTVVFRLQGKYGTGKRT